jgi:predicted metallo-beta-lactamase superfamily hydrolase
MKSIEKVKIRMYRQGLGDCFLLTFNDAENKAFNMLIDCGVLSKGKTYSDKMKDVAKSIKESTNEKLDVIVATHEHWDHLSGFLQARDVFDSMTVDEIWMAWTENPNDEYARKLKHSTETKLAAITAAYAKLKEAPTNNFSVKQKSGHSDYLSAFTSFFNFFGIDSTDDVLGVNGGGTGEAFDTLRKREKSKKVYLEPTNNNVIELKELPGVRIYVLGPPKDSKALNKMSPSKKNSEIYEIDYAIALGDNFNSAIEHSNSIENKDSNRPFNDRECIRSQDATQYYESYFKPDNVWRKIDNDWLFTAGNLAIALDSAVNNTSLALAFEFIETGKVLLFPADAQIGNWLSWSNYEWTIKNNGKNEIVRIDDLFRRTVFYKVGHHGSHNATMKERGLEKMISKELIAMIPVDQTMAKAKNWKMPFQPLLDALNEKTSERVIIQDEKYPSAIDFVNQVSGGTNDLYFDVVIHNK